MKHIVYHYYKEKNFSCGPSALRIAIRALIERDVGETILINLIGSNHQIGTPLSLFEENLKSLLIEICRIENVSNNFEFIIKQNSSIKELQELQHQDYVILLNYTKPDGGAHWAVLEEINR